MGNVFNCCRVVRLDSDLDLASNDSSHSSFSSLLLSLLLSIKATVIVFPDLRRIVLRAGEVDCKDIGEPLLLVSDSKVTDSSVVEETGDAAKDSK